MSGIAARHGWREAAGLLCGAGADRCVGRRALLGV